MIIGVDEVGRGCLAGPVCVAAVAMPNGAVAVADSKVLSARRRQWLARQIKQAADCVGIGWASAAFIDEQGLTAALKAAAKAALTAFGAAPELVLLDGNSNYLDDPRVVTLVDGDTEVPLISAASIIAKVARDTLMAQIDRRYPEYGFAQHVGYGTAVHLAALRQHGPSPFHRYSFKPVREAAHVN